MSIKTVPASGRIDTEPVMITPLIQDVTTDSFVTDTTGEEQPRTSIIPIEPAILRYDPEVVAAQYSKKPLQVLGRIFAVLLPSLSFALGLWWDRQRGRIEENQRRRA